MSTQSEIPLSVPSLLGNELEYLRECIETNFVSSVGPFVDRFEAMVRAWVGCRYAVATMNGTAALHVALLVAGVRPGDEVLMPSLTFVAPANAVSYAGAHPVFVGVEQSYWQLDPQRVVDFLESHCRRTTSGWENRLSGRPIRAILPVHILGHSADMRGLRKVARDYQLALVEDATESLGAYYDERPVGSLGDIACFSFNGNKIITTGGGGMIVTDRVDWADRARHLSTQAKTDPVEYKHDEIGYNYRLTNIQAAIGCAQMERLDEIVASKRQIAARYGALLKEPPGIRLPREAPNARSTFWLYTVLLDDTVFGKDSRAAMKSLSRRGIQTRPLWEPLHVSRAHGRAQSFACDYELELYHRALSLPSSVDLGDDGLQAVVHGLMAARAEILAPGI